MESFSDTGVGDFWGDGRRGLWSVLVLKHGPSSDVTKLNEDPRLPLNEASAVIIAVRIASVMSGCRTSRSCDSLG